VSASEEVFVTSRQAALLLFQGLQYHLQREHERARTCYVAGRDLYHMLGEGNGEGQAILALEMLEKGTQDDDLLRQMAMRQLVQGERGRMLAGRLAMFPLAEQLRVIEAARACGNLPALLSGLTSPHPAVQAAASAALNWLKPGPGYETILETLLVAENWLVRWQAICLLKERMSRDARAFARQRDRIHTALVRLLASGETDPLVRQQSVLLLLKLRNPADTPQLIRLLADPDPDVRFVAIQALDVLGDEQALLPLQQVEDATCFSGHHLKTAARTAIRHIQRRVPTALQEVSLSCAIAGAGPPAQSQTIFLLQQPPCSCALTLVNLDPTTRVSCRIEMQGKTIFHQEQTRLAQKRLHAVFFPTPAERSARQQESLLMLSPQEGEPLIELLDSPCESVRASPLSEVPVDSELAVLRVRVDQVLDELLAPDILLDMVGVLAEAIGDEIEQRSADFLDLPRYVLEGTRQFIDLLANHLAVLQPLGEALQTLVDAHHARIVGLVLSVIEQFEQMGRYDYRENFLSMQIFLYELYIEQEQEIIEIFQPLASLAEELFVTQSDDLRAMIEPLIDRVVLWLKDIWDILPPLFQPLTDFLQEFLAMHEDDLAELIDIDTVQELIEQVAEQVRAGPQGVEAILALCAPWGEKIATVVQLVLESGRDLLREHRDAFLVHLEPLMAKIQDLFERLKAELSTEGTTLLATVRDQLDQHQEDLSGLMAPFGQLWEQIERRSTQLAHSEPEEEERGQRASVMLFLLSEAAIAWSPGDYRLAIALNDVVVMQQTFQIVPENA